MIIDVRFGSEKNMLTYSYFIISKSYFKSGGAACLCYKDDPKFKNIPTDQILFPMPGEIGEVMSEPFGGMELSYALMRVVRMCMPRIDPT